MASTSGSPSPTCRCRARSRHHQHRGQPGLGRHPPHQHLALSGAADPRIVPAVLSRMRAALRPDQQVSPNRGRVVLLNLVLVLAFVVVAVIELTRTYVDARRIASSVDAANT